MKFTALLSLLFVGCNDSSDDTAAAEDFSPMEGTLYFTDVVYTSDACQVEANFPAEVIESTPQTVALTDAGFELTDPLGDVTVCTLSDMDYTCTYQSVTDVTEWTDAKGNILKTSLVITTDSISTGSFTDAMSATGTITVTGTCGGDDCVDYQASFDITDNPCTTTASFNAEIQM